MAWTDDDEAREAILLIIASIDYLIGHVEMPESTAEKIVGQLDRAREIAQRIDAPRPKKETP